MRIHEGKFAYDLEPRRNPQTQLFQSWRYQIFRLDPVEQVLETGEAATRAEAEKKAQAALSRLQTQDRRSAA